MTTEKIDLFLNQLNNADPPAAIDIVKKITEMPGLFVFGELLDHPNIQALRNTKYHMFYELLELFCYGSFNSLKSDAPKLPELSPNQLRKLKQLTIIEEAHARRFIPYDILLRKLNMVSYRELEDLIIELFCLGALSGKLNQQKDILEVESAIGRDIRTDEIPQLSRTLETWFNRVQSVLENISNETKLANSRRSETEKEQKKAEEAAASVKEAVRCQLSQEAADIQRMDIDDAFLHPDYIMFDSGRGACMRPFRGVDAPTGDKESRVRRGILKNLRRKQ